MKEFKPIGPYVVVEPDSVQDEKKIGALVIEVSNELEDKFKTGTVKALGTGVILPSTGRRTEFNVKVGDKVLYKDFTGSPLTIESKSYTVLIETDILGIIR